MSNLRLVGKSKIMPKRWKLITLIAAIILILLPFGFKWYTYVHSPVYTARIFVKAIMNGDEKTIDHSNYTDRHEQTIKKAWIDKLNGYDFKDLVFSVSDSFDEKINIKSTKNKDLYISIDVKIMNGSYYVTNVFP